MAIKKFKPVTPGMRFRSIVDNSDILTKKPPEMSLLEGLSKSDVRNQHGRITSRRRGGGPNRRWPVAGRWRGSAHREAGSGGRFSTMRGSRCRFTGRPKQQRWSFARRRMWWQAIWRATACCPRWLR